MAKTYRVKSPAKINIGLRVLSKRKDGFHNIETIFYPLKIYDEITVKISKLNRDENTVSIKTNPKGQIKTTDNICYKAAVLFLESLGINGNKIEINIRKKIPIGAGLGGGSSDAASVLTVLANHFKNPLKSKKLKKCALYLGSDVPFFLQAKPAYASGRGEKLKPLPKFRVTKKILVVNPGIHISTPWAYKQLRVKNYKLSIMRKVRKYNPADEKLMVNDFERVVFKNHPGIEKLKYDMFSFGAEFALMSGSGSTVYGIFSKEKIKAAEKYFRGLGYKIFIG